MQTNIILYIKQTVKKKLKLINNLLNVTRVVVAIEIDISRLFTGNKSCVTST